MRQSKELYTDMSHLKSIYIIHRNVAWQIKSTAQGNMSQMPYAIHRIQYGRLGIIAKMSSAKCHRDASHFQSYWHGLGYLDKEYKLDCPNPWTLWKTAVRVPWLYNIYIHYEYISITLTPGICSINFLYSDMDVNYDWIKDSLDYYGSWYLLSNTHVEVTCNSCLW